MVEHGLLGIRFFPYEIFDRFRNVSNVVTSRQRGRKARMSRDPGKLRVFRLADSLALRIYDVTKVFPLDERFGLTSQARRAAVSVCTKIVEGSGRRTEREYVRFLEVAYGSACELRFLLSLASRLGYLPDTHAASVRDDADHVCRALHALIASRR